MVDNQIDLKWLQSMRSNLYDARHTYTDETVKQAILVAAKAIELAVSREIRCSLVAGDFSALEVEHRKLQSLI